MQAGLKALASSVPVQLVGLGTENRAVPVGAEANGIPRNLLTAAVAPEIRVVVPKITPPCTVAVGACPCTTLPATFQDTAVNSATAPVTIFIADENSDRRVLRYEQGRWECECFIYMKCRQLVRYAGSGAGGGDSWG